VFSCVTLAKKGQGFLCCISKFFYVWRVAHPRFGVEPVKVVQQFSQVSHFNDTARSKPPLPLLRRVCFYRSAQAL